MAHLDVAMSDGVAVQELKSTHDLSRVEKGDLLLEDPEAVQQSPDAAPRHVLQEDGQSPAVEPAAEVPHDVFMSTVPQTIPSSPRELLVLGRGN